MTEAGDLDDQDQAKKPIQRAFISSSNVTQILPFHV